MPEQQASPSAQCTDAEAAVFQPHPLPWLALICVVYTCAFIAILPHCRYQINLDGLYYIQLAQYWAVGDFAHAVNGYWSPLLSWCLVPFVWLQVDLLWACKVVTGTAGLALALATYWLARRLGLLTTTALVASAAAAAMALQYATTHISPDLLLAVFVTLYMATAFDVRVLSRARSAFACGLVAGVAFLAKSYALPFVLAHYAVSAVLHRLTGKLERGPRALVIACWLAGLLVFAAPWISALSWKYGRFTVSTTAYIAHAIVAPDHTYGLHADPGFRIIPTHIQVDPTIQGNKYFYWSPFDSIDALVHQLKIITVNLSVIRNYLALLHQDGLFSAAIMVSLLGLLTLSGWGQWRFRQAWAIVTLAVYASGYALIFCTAPRYYWPLMPLALVLLFQYPDALARSCPDWLTGMIKSQRRAYWVVMGVLLLSSIPLVTVATVFRSSLGGTFERLANNFVPAQTDWLRPLTKSIGALGVRGPLGAVNFREAPYVAYSLGLEWGNRARATYPPDVVREAQAAGLASVLVLAQDDATRYYWRQLGKIGGARLLGEVSYPGMQNATIMVYDVAASRPAPATSKPAAMRSEGTIP
ncbi:MAG TPA: hypothetical protein DGT21_02940 [Armatimonadetes bacterium]|nr:hypothetical protein [Armatimonadota bacterium]